MCPASHSPEPDARLLSAAEAVQSGRFSEAVALYERLLVDAPQDPTLLRAHAAVSVLVRAENIDRSTDPIDRSDAAPQDVAKALDAADVLVLFDQPADAVDRLSGLLETIPKDGAVPVRRRLLELLTLLGPQDPAVERARRRLANATFP